MVVIASQFKDVLFSEGREELTRRVESLKLVAVSQLCILIFVGSSKSESVKDAASFWPNVETQLLFQVLVNVIDVEACLTSDQLHDTPVEKSERQLYLKRRVLTIPLLNVIDLVKL